MNTPIVHADGLKSCEPGAAPSHEQITLLQQKYCSLVEMYKQQLRDLRRDPAAGADHRLLTQNQIQLFEGLRNQANGLHPSPDHTRVFNWLLGLLLKL